VWPFEACFFETGAVPPPAGVSSPALAAAAVSAFTSSRDFEPEVWAATDCQLNIAAMAVVTIRADLRDMIIP
jgi:hypothetical protein